MHQWRTLLDWAGDVWMIVGDASPATGAGIDAGVGSLFVLTTPGARSGLYTKRGPKPTDWAAPGSPGIIDVLSSGAVGDGRTDDTAAIQSAIDTGSSSHSAVLLSGSPGRDFLITRPIQLRSGTTLISTGASLVQASSDAAVIQGRNVADVLLEGVRARYSARRARRTGGTIELLRSTRCVVQRCVVTDAPCMGILLLGCRSALVTDNYVEATLADGIHVTNGTAAGDVSREIVISANQCLATGDDGIAVVSYGAAKQLPCEGITIVGNSVTAPQTRGITVIGSGITVQGNAVRDVSGSAGINVLRDDSFNTYAPRAISVLGNVVTGVQSSTDSTRHGIRVYAASDVTVSANQVSWPAGQGIAVYGTTDRDCDGVLVTQNVVRGGPDSLNGVFVDQAQDVAVLDNLIRDVGGSGVYVDRTVGATVRANRIRRANLRANARASAITVGRSGSAWVDGNDVEESGQGAESHGIEVVSPIGRVRLGANHVSPGSGGSSIWFQPSSDVRAVSAPVQAAWYAELAGERNASQMWREGGAGAFASTLIASADATIGALTVTITEPSAGAVEVIVHRNGKATGLKVVTGSDPSKPSSPVATVTAPLGVRLGDEIALVASLTGTGAQPVSVRAVVELA